VGSRSALRKLKTLLLVTSPSLSDIDPGCGDRVGRRYRIIYFYQLASDLLEAQALQVHQRNRPFPRISRFISLPRSDADDDKSKGLEHRDKARERPKFVSRRPQVSSRFPAHKRGLPYITGIDSGVYWQQGGISGRWSAALSAFCELLAETLCTGDIRNWRNVSLKKSVQILFTAAFLRSFDVLTWSFNLHSGP
jgi:hypothetical protein